MNTKITSIGSGLLATNVANPDLLQQFEGGIIQLVTGVVSYLLLDLMQRLKKKYLAKKESK